MMQINVSQLLKAPIGSTRNYDVDGIIHIDDCPRTVSGKVRLMRTGNGILVRGNIRTRIELTCSRCLGVFEYPMTINIEEEYFPTTDIMSGAPLPVPEETESFTIDEHNILDLSESIRQYAVLAIPMKPLCRQKCAGLCPVCGINLNQESCDCSPEPADPRWAELRKLVLTDTRTSAKEKEGTN